MKRIIIIGATSGIGLEVARCYLKAGWQVGVAGRREEELEKLRHSAPGQVFIATDLPTAENSKTRFIRALQSCLRSFALRAAG